MDDGYESWYHGWCLGNVCMLNNRSYLRILLMVKRKATELKKRNLETPIVCICGHKGIPLWFTWANLDGKMVLLCWACTDKLHTNTIAREKKNDSL